mmetsp:Transcript_16035/g.31935  ORF Transcript_16035/g.31935 Transcript_16035/m.31935 type:complete len:208 (-) Transcript_16035:269-892(-)
MSVFPPLKDGIGPVRIHHPPAASSSPALNPLRYPQATNETNSCLSAGRSSLSWHCALSTPPPLPEYLWYTTNASTLEFRLLAGFATLTRSKRICSWSHRVAVSRPRKILATNAPPVARTCVEMFTAEKRSWAWMYSSMSCRPVTSGAPSHTTMSARPPEKWETISRAVETEVMSPWMQCTSPIRAIGCRSTETIQAYSRGPATMSRR